MSELNQTATGRTERQPRASRILNIDRLKTRSGILMILELLLAFISFGIILGDLNYPYNDVPVVFFYLTTVNAMWGTILFIGYSLESRRTVKSQAVHGFFFHSTAFVILLAFSLNLLIAVSNRPNYLQYKTLSGAAICGLVNSALCLSSMILAFRSLRASYPAENIAMSELNSSATISTAPHPSTPHFIFNIGYLKTFSGILKVLELVVGIICVGLISYSLGHYDKHGYFEVWFITITIFAVINTFILILDCLILPSTESIISINSYESSCYSIDFFFFFVSTLILLVNIHIERYDHYAITLAAFILGLVNSVLYFISMVFSCRECRNY